MDWLSGASLTHAPLLPHRSIPLKLASCHFGRDCRSGPLKRLGGTVRYLRRGDIAEYFPNKDAKERFCGPAQSRCCMNIVGNDRSVAPPNVSLGPENTHNNDDVECQSVSIHPDHNTLPKNG